MYKIFFVLGKIYTIILKRKFQHFGKNSIIKPFLNSANEKAISIGKNVNIGAFNRITAIEEFGGKRYQGQSPVKIKIGDNVDIGNNSFITANNSIEIGDNVIMSSYVFISDHDHGFAHIDKDLRDQPLTENGFVKIGKNVFLGVKSSVLKNVTIGERAVVAANAVVTKDVPAYTIVAGNPARIIKKFDFEQNKWIKSE